MKSGTCALQRVVHFKAQAEHTWPLNIYLNLEWPREGETPNVAKYNIISFDSNIDETPGSNQHQINRVRKLFRDYWLYLSSVFFSHVQSSKWPSNKHSASWLQLRAGEERRRALKRSVRILWRGATSLLWSQSHNLNQSSIPVKLCLLHFFIMCFYPSNCCSLLLW